MNKTFIRFFDAVDLAVEEAEAIISHCCRHEGLCWSVKQCLILGLNRVYLTRFKKCRPPVRICFATALHGGRPVAWVRVLARFRNGWQVVSITRLGPLATTLLTQCAN